MRASQLDWSCLKKLSLAETCIAGGPAERGCAVQMHRGPRLEARKWIFTTTGSQPMRGMPILGPELTCKRILWHRCKGSRLHTQLEEVPSFLNFVYTTHRFPAISSQAHVEFQAECQQEWKGEDTNKRCQRDTKCSLVTYCWRQRRRVYGWPAAIAWMTVNSGREKHGR